MSPDERPPVGFGLPWFVDTRVYFSADETRALPPTRYSNGRGTCLICGEPPGGPTFRLEGAHVANKGAGGRGDGKEGPTVEICYACHQGQRGLHRHGNRTLAVARDSIRPVLLEYDAETDTVTERALRWAG
jgi:hypothetical protein